MIVKIKTVSNPDSCCSPKIGLTLEGDNLSSLVLYALERMGFHSHVLEVRIINDGTTEAEMLAKQIIGKIDGSEWGRIVRKREV